MDWYLKYIYFLSFFWFFFLGIFKLKKVDLRKEGFDFSIVKDFLYCLIFGKY